MLTRLVFTFLKNFIVFLVDRLYKEWEYIIGYDRSHCESASERGDLYAKHIIENIIHDRISKYDPYMLDGCATISWGRTSVGLGNAQLTGLSSLHRTNICFLAEEGNRLFINANLGAGPITYRRPIELRFGEFERKAVVLVSAIDIKVSVDFSVEKGTGRNGFLLNFSIRKLNGFKLRVTGFDRFDWAINLFLSFWTFVLGRIVRNLLENELEQHILKRIPKYQFPVEGASCGNEGSENGDASPSESFQMKQSYRNQQKSLSFPIDENAMYDGQDSEEYVGPSMETANSTVTNKRSFQIKGFYLPDPSSGLYRGCLCTSCCSEVCGERIDLSLNVEAKVFGGTIDFSLNVDSTSGSFKVTEELDSLADRADKWSEEIASDLQNFKRFESNVSGELDTVESNGRESESSTSVATSFEDELSSPACEEQGRRKKLKSEEFPQIFLPYNEVKRDFKLLHENSQKLLVESFPETGNFSSELEKSINENVISREIQFSKRMGKLGIPSPKSESLETDKNIFEPSMAETESFPGPSPNFDYKKNKQIDNSETAFTRVRRRRKAKYSLKKKQISRKSPKNFNFNLNDTENIQNESLISCASDVSVKHLNVVPEVRDPEYEPEIEDAESIKSNGKEIAGDLETSKPQVDVQTCYRFDFILENENNLEQDIETDSTSEQDENEVDEGIVNLGFLAEDELNDDWQLVSRKRKLFPYRFPAQSSGICSGSLQENSSHEDVDEFAESKWDNFSDISRIFTTLKEKTENVESRVHSASSSSRNSFPQERTKPIDFEEGFAARSSEKLNKSCDENNLISTSDSQPLTNLQKEIITNIKEAFYKVLSCTEDYEFSSNLNREYQTGESICDDANRLLQKDSNTNLDVPLQISLDNLSSAETLSTHEPDSEISE